MTRLLVSVRDAREAALALEAGAALIDVKEPLHGSLGAADPARIREVCRVVAGRVPVSAALGELLEGTPDARRLPESLAFAKLGLAGCAALSDWPKRWSAALKLLPARIQPVAVVYADWVTARAPAPLAILAEAFTNRCAAVLVDTFDKSSGPLLSHWSLADLGEFVDAVHKQQLIIVLGGSLISETIEQVLPLRPDYVAVRGAVCPQSRTGELDGWLVAQLVRLINGSETLQPLPGPLGR